MRAPIFLFILLTLSACGPEKAPTVHQKKMATDRWQYIEIDSTKVKWGDFAEPEWLRYFGLDAADLNGDGYLDVVTGRNVYLSPGGELNANWQKVDLGLNVDAMLAVDVNNNGRADLIAEALPDVYHLEATSSKADAWEAKVVAQIPPTSHHNGQGYRKAQVIPGGPMEVLLSSQEGIYLLQLPQSDTASWKVQLIGVQATDEGFAVGDLDGDGDLDVAGGRRGPGEEEPTLVVWFENPGDGSAPWPDHMIGQSENSVDRIEMADFDGDGKNDLVVTEERYPGLEADANLYVFLNRYPPAWHQTTIVTQYSMNNLDVADFNQDGHMDLVTSEHKGEDLNLQLWLNNGEAKFTKQEIDHGKEAHLGTRVYDMDGDGDLDILSIGWDQHKYVHLWRNDGGL